MRMRNRRLGWLVLFVLAPLVSFAGETNAPAPGIGTPVNSPTVNSNLAPILVQRDELVAEQQKLTEKMEALFSEERQIRADSRKQSQELEGLMRARPEESKDEETRRLKEELAKVELRAKDLKDAIQKRMEGLPEYQAARKKEDEGSARLTELCAKEKELVKQRAEIAHKMRALVQKAQEARGVATPAPHVVAVPEAAGGLVTNSDTNGK